MTPKRSIFSSSRIIFRHLMLISVWSEQRFYPSSGRSILSTALFHRQKMTPIYQIQSGDLVVPSVIIPFSVFAMKLLVKATAVGILCRICSLCEKSIEFPDFSSIVSLVLSHRQKTSSIYLIHHSDFVVLWVIIPYLYENIGKSYCRCGIRCRFRSVCEKKYGVPCRLSVPV